MTVSTVARRLQQKKAPFPGPLSQFVPSLVFGDHWAGPVEAIDQRGADSLDPRLELKVGSRQYADSRQLADVLAAIVGRAIFRLHEPAGSRDAEDVQVVLDTTADEPAIAVERAGVETDGSAGKAIEKGTARPVRAAVTAVDIRKNVRGDQVTGTYARGPRILHLDPAGDSVERILDVAPQTAELAVSEETDHPARVDLPVIAKTDGAEPAVTTLGLMDAERITRHSVAGKGVRIPDAAADAAEDIEAGPARSHNRGRSLGVGPGGQVGSRRGSRHGRRCNDR
jgi:hypothetical protein